MKKTTTSHPLQRHGASLVLAITTLTLAACAAPDQGIAIPAAITVATPCNATPDASQTQYIIGYGSLMQDESRKRTAPKAGSAYPVVVQGYRRGWFARGGSVGFDTTFLGLVADANSRLNAVVYQIDAAEIALTDKREFSYCRQNVPAEHLTALVAEAPAAKGQLWIYVSKPEGVATASARHPLVQSYVDIFVSGCLEQEQRFGLKGFAQQCLTTTSDWSRHWVNDRIYPRRPFIYQPKARQIDALLAEHLPEYFAHIRLETGQ